MSLVGKGMPLSGASDKAGMSEPTARKYRKSGKLPSDLRRRHDWKTRSDPFDEAWPEILPLLETDAGLQAKTIFEDLQRRCPGKHPDGQLRTLQRRIRKWRALRGPDQEVFFAQEYQPGQQAQSDFTWMNSLAVTIEGQPFDHIAYHFVLPYSNYEYAELAYSETFEALSEGLQNALWFMGAVPGEHRTDCLSAATHDLRHSRGRGFNARYLELLGHYGLAPSKIKPGKANENGDVEQGHHRFKEAVDQRLRLRGSRDFLSRRDYLEFLRDLVAERNRNREAKFREELQVMRALPQRRVDSFRDEVVTVTRWSIVRVAGKTYSVPSRLIGYQLRARIHAAEIELEYGGTVVERMERLRGEGHRIDYRHLVHSLIRKPGAFKRYVYREALFPTVVFRKAYDSLVAQSDKWADLEYVRILHLAATTMESKVGEALSLILTEGEVPEYDRVKAIAAPEEHLPCPRVEIHEPDLTAYDALLESEEVLA
jgi:transposase